MSERTLYITDLDGTLLNSSKQLGALTIELINRIIDRKIPFSVATARSAGTALQILEPLRLELPVVLLNGVAVYDITRKEYVHVEAIPEEGSERVLKAMEELGLKGFMYTISDNEQITYYEELYSPAMEDFHQERVNKYKKVFEKVPSLKDKINPGPVVYFTLLDLWEKLKPLKDALDGTEGIEVALYRDVYSTDGWFLEVYSTKASKYNAVCFMREHYGFDKIIGFGDNHNDLPLFRACDEAYAVINAVEALKVRAKGLVHNCNSDGVARFIARREKIL